MTAKRQPKIRVGECVTVRRRQYGIPLDLQPGRVIAVNPRNVKVIWARGSLSSWVDRRHLVRVRCSLYTFGGTRRQ